MFCNLGHTNKNYSDAIPVKVCRPPGDMLLVAVSSVPDSPQLEEQQQGWQWSDLRKMWEWDNVSNNHIILNSSPKKVKIMGKAFVIVLQYGKH